MEYNKIETEIKSIIANHLGLSFISLSNNDNIEKDLSGDWFDKMELIISIEEMYNIILDEKTKNNVHTISDLINIVKSRVE